MTLFSAVARFRSCCNTFAVVDAPSLSFLYFRLVGLEVVLAGGQRRLHRGPVVGQRILPVDDLNAHLDIELLQPHFRLAIFEQGASLQRLRRAIAQRNIHVDAGSLIGAGAVEEVGEDRAVAHGGNIAGRGAKKLRLSKTGSSRRREPAAP